MHIITGGTGHIGSALAEALLKKGEKVTIVSRSAEKANEWENKGAQVAITDIHDTAALHEVFKQGKSVFVLNPPAEPSTNTDIEERKTVTSLVAALKDSGIEKVVAESTIGAQPGSNIADLGILYELERGVSKLPYSCSIIRASYYMSNWDEMLPSIMETGEMMSFLPAGFRIGMVAPKDIGALAARLLTEKDSPRITGIQGPELYTPNDVAAAFSKALNKDVKVKAVPREQLKDSFMSVGFSEAAAGSYANMTALTIDNRNMDIPDNTVKGSTTLQQYIDELVSRSS